jgi:Mrp family chromosome partitioning ATPase
MTDSALSRRLKRVKQTILVLSGKGGVGTLHRRFIFSVFFVCKINSCHDETGKSTIAVHLANALVANGKKVGVIGLEIIPFFQKS